MGQTFVDRLADIIHILQLARKTGRLSVDHIVAGSLSERGIISFKNGQIAQASTGVYQGVSALEKLKTWRDCRFVFCPGDPGEEQAPYQEISNKNNGAHKEPQEPAGAPPVTPYRVQEIDKALPRFSRLGLSRVHWRLFLLVDGHRSTIQLARLLGRSVQETSVLLFDLERAYFIQR
ncbi:MAG TPA: DUF4388 domain-containing protein [Ktedonobacteraceae bacterium]|nr:DUF4388 domain-containing protein [Ktedonobacteraceae bacterium]